MTIDKIEFYIGKQMFNFISALDEQSLKNMKKNILADINGLFKHESKTLFLRTIELEFINQRLK